MEFPSTLEGTVLWQRFNDYMLMADDPKYQTLHAFRKAIDKINDPRDKQILVDYFNQQCGGSHVKTTAWDYYKDPY